VGDHKRMQAGEQQLKQNELGNSKWPKSIYLLFACQVYCLLCTICIADNV